MKPSLRKLTLTTHIVSSVGWVGAVIAYLVLAVAGLSTPDTDVARAAYLSMELIGRYAIVPLCWATLATGLVDALWTPWGLLRHWWVLVKLLLATVGSVILMRHMQVVSRAAALARDTIFSAPDFRVLRIQLIVHAVGGLVVLLTATVLSVYKPWGMTPYGLRRRRERRDGAAPEVADQPVPPARSGVRPDAAAPRWMLVVALHAIGFAVLLLVIHASGIGFPSH